MAQLSPEQTQVVRQHLEDYWFKQFGDTLASIRAKLPADIPESEIEADIAAAVRKA